MKTEALIFFSLSFFLLVAVKRSSREANRLPDELTARNSWMWLGGPEPDQGSIWSTVHPAG